MARWPGKGKISRHSGTALFRETYLFVTFRHRVATYVVFFFFCSRRRWKEPARREYDRVYLPYKPATFPWEGGWRRMGVVEKDRGARRSAGKDKEHSATARRTQCVLSRTYRQISRPDDLRSKCGLLNKYEQNLWLIVQLFYSIVSAVRWLNLVRLSYLDTISRRTHFVFILSR